MLRQLIATGAVRPKGDAGQRHEFDTLCLTDGSRAVLKGRGAGATARIRLGRRAKRARKAAPHQPPPPTWGPDAQVRFINLKAWRAEVAWRTQPAAYVIFHDATLAAIAERNPASLDDLQGISGMGAKKLEAYGSEVLRVCAAAQWNKHPP